MQGNNDTKQAELMQAAQVLGIAHQVVEVVGHQRDAILAQIKHRFVQGNPRVWWLSFAKPPRCFHFDDEEQYKRINQFFDPEQRCYLVAEFDDLHLFILSIHHIIAILGECSFFEYYIVGLDLAQLLCETEHGDLLYIGDGLPAIGAGCI